MSQSQVTEYFHGRKRNNNFQPSKRQKVDVESHSSAVPTTGTLQINTSSVTKKTGVGIVQTKSATGKKNNTRSRIPQLQKESNSRNVRLNDIWPKSSHTTFSSDLITDTDHTSIKVPPNSRICRSVSSKQDVNVTESRKSSTRTSDDNADLSNDHADVLVTATDTINTVSGDKLPASPSKRHVHYKEVEEGETSTESDVATAVIDDHGNSHSCTPSKRRTVEPGVVSTVVNNKRGRCLVPTNSSNYYKTPQKFDFSPYQQNTSNQRSSSARKKLVLSSVDVTKSPPVFVFKGSKKSPESPIVDDAKEKALAEVQIKAKDIKSNDKAEYAEDSSSVTEEVEPAVETVVSKTRSKEAKTPSKNASEVVKIGTCRNLEQLKKKLRELSPRKAKASITGDDSASVCKSESTVVSKTRDEQLNKAVDSELSVLSICTPSRPKPTSRLQPKLSSPVGKQSTKAVDSKLALMSFCTPSRAKSSLSARRDHLPHPHSTSLSLPHSYYVLGELFQSADTIVSWLTNRAEICTFEKLKSAVQDMTKRAFSQKHLGQIHTVYPTAYKFQQEKDLPMFGGKVCGYQLTIEAILDATSDDNDDGNVKKNSVKKFTAAKMLSRKDIFYRNMLTIVKSYHREFLNKLNMCSSIKDDQIQQWHPKFVVDDVPDVEPALLPQPPVVKKFMTAKDVLDEVKDRHVDPQVRKALEHVANKTPPTVTPNGKTPQKLSSPTQGPSKVTCSPKGLPQSLLERIRAKEAQKIEAEMTRNPQDIKRRAMLQRLPELTRIVRTHFLSQKRPALPLPDIVKSFKDSYKTALGAGDAESHLRLIAEVVPDFLSIIRLKSGEYVKIHQLADLSSVHDVIQNIIKAV